MCVRERTHTHTHPLYVQTADTSHALLHLVLFASPWRLFRICPNRSFRTADYPAGPFIYLGPRWEALRLFPASTNNIAMIILLRECPYAGVSVWRCRWVASPGRRVCGFKMPTGASEVFQRQPVCVLTNDVALNLADTLTNETRPFCLPVDLASINYTL